MRSTWDVLEKELNELRALVASIKPVNDALQDHHDSHIHQYVAIRRRYDHAAFFVSLYATFERFIENLVSDYARLFASRETYVCLPKKLQEKHLKSTADLLACKELGTGRYAGVHNLDLVRNLFECLKGEPKYTLNEAAIVAHRGNLKCETVDDLFLTVGIEKISEQVHRTDAMRDWYCKSMDLDPATIETVPITIIKEKCKDVVERRNQVAHRGGNPDEFISLDLMLEMMSDTIDFFAAFAKSLFSIAVGKYLQDQHIKPVRSINLIQRHDGRFKEGTVVVVERPSQRLFVNQPVFIISEANGACWGRIRSLQIEKVDVKAIEPDDDIPNGIGIALDFKCPRNTPLHALTSEDDVVWSPLP